VVTLCAEEGGAYGDPEETHHPQGGGPEGCRDAKAPGRQGCDHAKAQGHAAEVDGQEDDGPSEVHRPAQDHRPEGGGQEGGRDASSEDGHPQGCGPEGSGHPSPEGGRQEDHGPQDHPPQEHNPAEDHRKENDGEEEDHRQEEDDRDPEADRRSEGTGPEADHHAEAGRGDSGSAAHHPADHPSPTGAGSIAGADPLGRRRGDLQSRGISVVVGLGGGAPLLDPSLARMVKGPRSRGGLSRHRDRTKKNEIAMMVYAPTS
jgi:hypothetical protein